MLFDGAVENRAALRVIFEPKDTVKSEIRLEGIRDQLKEVAESYAAEDRIVKIKDLRLQLSSKQGEDPLHGVYLMEAGTPKEGFRISRNALKQLCDTALPAGGLRFLDALYSLGDTGEKLASVNLSAFLGGNESDVTLRIANIGEDRAIRSVRSANYAAVDDLEVVNALLNNPEIANLPVLSAISTDGHTRIRLALEDAIEVARPFKMMEFSNSEIGLRAVSLKAGIYRLACLNGVGGWTSGHRWNHVGDPARIKAEIAAILQDISGEATRLSGLYQKALSIGVENMYKFMEHVLREGGFSSETINKAIVATTDPTTTQGNSLATVVDAVTLTAQSVPLEDSCRLEQQAGRLLNSFVEIAGKSGGKIDFAPLTTRQRSRVKVTV